MPRWLWMAAWCLGLVYLFLIPPFQIADEPEHLARAYQLSEGKLHAEKRRGRAGGEFSASFVAGLKFLSRVPHKGYERVRVREVVNEFLYGFRFRDPGGRKEFFAFSNMALYSPIPYVPQMVALSVARVANLTVAQGMYLARLFTFFTVFGIVSFALALLGEGTRVEWQLFLLLSLPMALTQMASSSADALCIALAVLNLALLARIFAEPTSWLWSGLFLSTTGHW